MPFPCDNVSVEGGFDALGYSYANLSPSGRITVVQSENELWCAVIRQALVDAGVITPASPYLVKPPQETGGKNYRSARDWLLNDADDFPYVCSLAGVSPFVIRRVAQQLMTSQEEGGVPPHGQ